MSGIQTKNYAAVTPKRVAFLGLGVMGYPMAGHLAQAGHHVTVYNRTAAKAQAWLNTFSAVAQTPTVALTPRQAVVQADVVFCCVGNDDDLRAVTLGAKQGTYESVQVGANVNADGNLNEGAFAGMKKGAVFVDHTTASAGVARELAQVAQSLGMGFVDAPVSGGQAGAQNGLLTVMCGGLPEHVDTIRPVALAFAKAVTRVGDAGAGQLAKMVNQICVAGLIQALAEGIAFGKHAGLDMAQVLHVLGQGAAQSWQMQNRGATMIEEQFDFGFAVDLMRKDLALVLEEARHNGSQLPVTALVDQFYADVQQMKGGRWDTSSLVKRLTI